MDSVEDKSSVLAFVHLGRIQRAAPYLSAFLREESPLVKREAVNCVKALYAREAVPDLFPLLKHPATDVRRAALEACHELELREATESVTPLLKDADSSIRKAAAATLGRFRARGAWKDILPLLEDKSPSVQEKAARTLGQLGVREAIPRIVPLLKSEYYDVREEALWALAALGASEEWEVVAALLDTETTSPLWYVCDVLGYLGNRDAAGVLVKALRSKEELVRRSAGMALGVLEAKEAVPQVVALLSEKDYRFRLTACLALGELDAKDRLPEIVSLLGDRTRNLQESALQVLGIWNAREAIPDIRRYLESEKGWLGPQGALCLSRLEVDGVKGSIIPLLDDGGFISTRAGAAKALGLMGATEALPKLKATMIRDLSGRYLVPVVEAIARIEGRRSAPLLRSIIKKRGLTTHPRIVRMLGDVGAEEAVSDLKALLEGSAQVSGHLFSMLASSGAVAESLCILGHDDGVPVLLFRAERSESNLFTLNRLTHPDMYRAWKSKRLSGARNARSPLEALKLLAVEMELEFDATEEVKTSFFRKWKYARAYLREHDNMVPLVEGLESVLSTLGLEYVITPGRMQVFTPREARLHWTRWWAERKHE